MTYAAKIDKAEARVDLAWDAAVLARHINGLSPFPGAWIERDGARVKLLRAEALEAEADGDAGTIQDDKGLVIATGQGALRLLTVQPAGKGAQDGTAFRNGARLTAGDRLDG